MKQTSDVYAMYEDWLFRGTEKAPRQLCKSNMLIFQTGRFVVDFEELAEEMDFSFPADVVDERARIIHSVNAVVLVAASEATLPEQK